MGNTIKQTLEEDSSEGTEHTNSDFPKNNVSLNLELPAGNSQGNLEEKPPPRNSGGQFKTCSLKKLIDDSLPENSSTACAKKFADDSEACKETDQSINRGDGPSAQNFKALQYKETIDYIIEGYFKTNKFPSKVTVQINNNPTETSKDTSTSEGQSVNGVTDECKVPTERVAQTVVSKPFEDKEVITVATNELPGEDSSRKDAQHFHNVNNVNNSTLSKGKSNERRLPSATPNDRAPTATQNDCISGKKLLNISAIIDQVIDNSLTKEAENSPEMGGKSLTSHIDETQKASPTTNIMLPKLSVKSEIKAAPKSEGCNGFLSLKDHIDSILQKSILEDCDIDSEDSKKEPLPRILPLVDGSSNAEDPINKTSSKTPISSSTPMYTTSKPVPSSTVSEKRGNYSGNTSRGMSFNESEWAHSLSKDSKVAGQQIEMKRLLEIPTTHPPFRKLAAPTAVTNALPTTQGTIRNVVVSNDSDRMYINSFHSTSSNGPYQKHRNDIQHSQKYHNNVSHSPHQTNNSNNNKTIPPLIHAGTYLANKYGYTSVSQTYPQVPYTRQNLSTGFNEGAERGHHERINAIPPERMIAVPPERMNYSHPPSNVHNVQYQRPLQLVPQNVVKPSPIVQQNLLGAQTLHHHANCQCISCVRRHPNNCACVQCLAEKSYKKEMCSQDNRRLDVRDYEFPKVYNKTHPNLTTSGHSYPTQQAVGGGGYLIKPNPQPPKHQELSPIPSTYLQGAPDTQPYRPMPEKPPYKSLTHSQRESSSRLSQFESTSMYIPGTNPSPESEQFRDAKSSKISSNCLDLSVSNETSEGDTPLDLTVSKSTEIVQSQLGTFRHGAAPSQQRDNHLGHTLYSPTKQTTQELQKNHYSQLYPEAIPEGFRIKSPLSVELQSMEGNSHDTMIAPSVENATNRNMVYRPPSNHKSPSLSVNPSDTRVRSPSQIPTITNQQSSPRLTEEAPFPVPMKVATRCLSPDVSPVIQSLPQTPESLNGSNRTPTPTEKKDSNYPRRGSISKHEPIQNILGTNLPSDVLYLICRLCGQTYGSPYGFRKHFRNQHGFEPRAEHTIVQTISATKSAMKVQDGSSNSPRLINERTDQRSATETAVLPSVTLYSADNVKQKCTDYGNTDTHENTEDTTPTTVTRNPRDVIDSGVNKSEETKYLECPECQQTFQLNDFGSYKRHCRQHNNSKNVTLLSCSDCHATFQDSVESKDHMLSHTSEYFRCRFCSLVFCSNHYLQEHLKTSHSLDSVKSGLNVSHPDTIIRSNDINRQPADQIGAISASPDSSTAQEVGTSNESKLKPSPRVCETVVTTPDSVQDTKEDCSRQRSDAANTSQEINKEETKKCDSEETDANTELVYKHKKFSLPRKRHETSTSIDAPPQKINCVSSSDNVCRSSNSVVDSTQCISGSEKSHAHNSLAVSSNGDSPHNHPCDSGDEKCVKVKTDEDCSKDDSDHKTSPDIQKYPSVHPGKLKFNGSEIKQEARHNLPYVWDRVTRTQAGKSIKPPDYM